jgi:hypothetical protein
MEGNQSFQQQNKQQIRLENIMSDDIFYIYEQIIRRIIDLTERGEVVWRLDSHGQFTLVHARRQFLVSAAAGFRMSRPQDVITSPPHMFAPPESKTLKELSDSLFEVLKAKELGIDALLDELRNTR